MSYRTETTGAISKAIVKLSQIADLADNIADHEVLSIMATNAAAELDALHHDNNVYSALLEEVEKRRENFETMLGRLLKEEEKIKEVRTALKKARSVFDAAYVHEDLRLAEKYIDGALAILEAK
jgi:hypothetical protein